VAASKLQLGRPKVYRSPGAAPSKGDGSGGGGGGGGGSERALSLPRPGDMSFNGGGSGGDSHSTGLVARRPNGGGGLMQQQQMQPLIPDTSYYESRAEAVRAAPFDSTFGAKNARNEQK